MNTKTKDVFISVLAGIGILILTLIPSIYLFQNLGSLIMDPLLPTICQSRPNAPSCPDVFGISSNVGALISIIAGIVAGRLTYKHRKGESVKISQRPIIVWIIIAFIVIAFILSLPILFLN